MKARHKTFTICFGVVGSAAALGQWTHYAAGANRNSVAHDAPRNLSRIAWQVSAASDEQFIPSASPVSDGAHVFIMARHYSNNGISHDGNRLIALDVATGDRDWTAMLPPDVLESWSSPAVDMAHGTLIVATGNRINAISTATGATVWFRDLPRAVVNASPLVTTDLLSDDGVPVNRVFITDYSPASEAALYAINTDAFDAVANPLLPGEVDWARPMSRLAGATPAYRDGAVYVATAGGRIEATDARSGSSLWSTPVSPDTFFGAVTVRAGFLYAASYRFNGGFNNSRLFKLNATSGAVLWTTPCERTDSAPVVLPDGRILLSAGIFGFGSVPKLQMFRDLGTAGALIWDTYADTAGQLIVGSWNDQPVVAGGIAFVGRPTLSQTLDPFTDLLALNLGRRPSDPDFIRDEHAGSGGPSAICGGYVYSVGVDGVFAFESTPPHIGDSEVPVSATPAGG